MKTLHFFRFDSDKKSPRISTFTVTFDDSGGMIINADETLKGVFVLEQGHKLVERTDGQETGIPIIQTLRDPQIRIFDGGSNFCFASGNEYIVEAATYFFSQGFHAAIGILSERIEEIQSANLAPQKENAP